MYKNAYVAAGFPAASFKLTIYGEPEDSGTGFTAAQYIAYYNYFAPTIQAAGIKCCYDPGSGKGESAQAAYWPGTVNGGSDAHIDEVYVDYYGTSWPATTLATIEGLADSINVPFGIAEFNATAKGTFSGVFYDGTVNSYIGYIISVMQARITAGKQNAWMIMYCGFNVASIPLPQDNIPSAADFKVAGLQALYDALASGGGSGSPTIAAGASYKVPPINPTPGGNFAVASGLSYDISVSLTAGALSTLPFATVQLNWLNQDSNHAQPVATQRWSVAMSASTGTGEVTIGAGPQRGQFLQVIITNKDSVTCTVNNVMINSTARNIGNHDWYWDAAGSNLPAFTTDSIATVAAGGQQDGNSLGSVNQVSIPANGSKAYVFGLFTGQVWFRCNGPGGNLQYVLKPVPTSVWGSAALVNEAPSGEFTTLMVLPRAPCVVEISNSDAANPHNAFVEIIARD
jgi:hypothetical protein